jgi:nicotinate-nucleotide pyrophosphorylase (carboxylating)
MQDIRNDIFRSIAGRTVTAAIVADDGGIIAETAAVESAAKELDLTDLRLIPEGHPVAQGDEIARFCGRPEHVAKAEERLIGLMAKASGIATAARRFVDRAGPDLKVVSGAWKKMPLSLKEMIRRSITTGGASCRISDSPFLYLDKNYVVMLGGIRQSLEAIADLNGYLKVIQLSGAYQNIALEACEAVTHGADIVFIDSGRPSDAVRTTDRLSRLGLRSAVKVAFGGSIRLEDIDALKEMDLDILDIGRHILDSPLLDMHLEVIGTTNGERR